MSKKLIPAVSIVAYTATILVASSLFIIEPNGFEARAVLAALIILLFLCSLGISYRIASKTNSKALKIAGTVALAILFTFIGFFIVAAVAWFVGLYHA